MSRIRGIEAKVKKEILNSVKKKNEPDTVREKDDVEREQVEELLAKLPKLAKTFNVYRKIGEGTFSSVYLGSMRRQSGPPDAEKKLYAIKHLVPTTHPTRVAHELRCLREIGGKNHVIGVELCLRNLDHVVFIMPYIPHRKFSEYVAEMGTSELRCYMRALLTALRHVHSFGVIHRDVKPSNFLYDRENRRYALVDFGLAQHTAPPTKPVQPPPAHQSLKRPRDDEPPLPGAKRVALDLTMRSHSAAPVPKPVLQPILTRDRNAHLSPPPAHSAAGGRPPCACAGVAGVCSECAAWAPPHANRAGTQGFRPPEVLLKYAAQGTAVDMWAAGVVLASVLSGRYPFFRGTSDMSALAEIMAVLGTPAMKRTASALGCLLVTSTPRYGICLRKMTAYLRDAGSTPAGRDCPHCPHCPHCPSQSPGRGCDTCRLPPPHCVCLDYASLAHEIDPSKTYGGYPDSAFALAARLLEPDPRARITAAEALRHPFLQP